ncbi:MAG: hypothetical protein WA373_10160 [Burkholderiales bacterium]
MDATKPAPRAVERQHDGPDVEQVPTDRKFNPELFARLADGDGFALIQRSRALRREACCARAQTIGTSLARQYATVRFRVDRVTAMGRFQPFRPKK